MTRFLLSLCLLAALLAAFAVTPCVANTADGTIAQERVITLPQDQGKWYVSVVGDPQDARYREVLTWFDSGELLKLRNSVHYNIVLTDSAIYKERYAANTPTLPMVRLQNPGGVIYSQVCGTDLPMTGQALSNQIAKDVKSGPKTGCLLRRRCGPDATPATPVTPVQPLIPDPKPGPVNNDDAPAIKDLAEPPDWILGVLCLVGFLAGGAIGVVSTTKARWKDEHR